MVVTESLADQIELETMEPNQQQPNKDHESSDEDVTEALIHNDNEMYVQEGTVSVDQQVSQMFGIIFI